MASLPPVNAHGKPKLVFFGAGGAGEAYLEHSGVQPDFFVDNQISLHGTLLEGVPVHSPKTLAGADATDIVITSGYVTEIRAQLRELGIPESRISLAPKSMMGFHFFETLEVRERFATVLSRIFETLSNPGETVASGGTALGFWRESDFLHWDFDADFLTPTHARSELTSVLGDSGVWNLSKSSDTEMIGEISCGIGPPVPVGLKFFNAESSVYVDKYLEKAWTWPMEMLSQPAQVSVHGHHFFVPNPPEHYLSEVFGKDWSTPRPIFTYDDYGGES